MRAAGWPSGSLFVVRRSARWCVSLVHPITSRSATTSPRTSTASASWCRCRPTSARAGCGGCTGFAQPLALEAFSGYLEALDEYTWRDVSIATLAEHDAMLDRISGNLFAFMPYLTQAQRRTIRGFGMLDHFYNNLRDLAE